LLSLRYYERDYVILCPLLLMLIIIMIAITSTILACCCCPSSSGSIQKALPILPNLPRHLKMTKKQF
jgi:hypothetical protein